MDISGLEKIKNQSTSLIIITFKIILVLRQFLCQLQFVSE